MLSYIYMKILEQRPQRYDRGIELLSGGHLQRIKSRIVQQDVRPGLKVLDLGCGTGSFLLEAVRAGAEATGIDLSAGMLAVAYQQFKKSGLQDKVDLHQAGATEIEDLFPDESFDLVVSTLVFSELYTDERTQVLAQVRRLLKPTGRLVIATEVKPRTWIKRFLHALLRLPLATLTFLIAQTGTRPWANMAREIEGAGFSILAEERSFLDSFAVLRASPGILSESVSASKAAVCRPEEDQSLLRSLWDFLGRWFPNPVEPGLRVIGQPNRQAPVIVTSNFHLTVRRVERAVKDLDLYLLVAPSNGINVWCASCGGEWNTHSLIATLKTSRIAERVDHRKVILPQFSAPGIDRTLLRKETGFGSRFGPAYVRDLPEFLQDPKSLFKHNHARFPLLFRLEMLLSMNFLVWLFISVLLLIVNPALVAPLALYFWSAGFILYAGYPLLPGKSGWFKAVLLSFVELGGTLLTHRLWPASASVILWSHLAYATVINLWLGFDLRGIVAGEPSEAEWLMQKLGMASFGHLFSAESIGDGKIHQDVDLCNDCRVCLMVCPKNVFGMSLEHRIRIQRRRDCFACTACVAQCPERALELGVE